MNVLRNGTETNTKLRPLIGRLSSRFLSEMFENQVMEITFTVPGSIHCWEENKSNERGNRTELKGQFNRAERSYWLTPGGGGRGSTAGRRRAKAGLYSQLSAADGITVGVKGLRPSQWLWPLKANAGFIFTLSNDSQAADPNGSEDQSECDCSSEAR